MAKEKIYSPQYVDLGKVFDRTAASEFTALDYSDANLLQFASSFYNTLAFPEREGVKPPSFFIQRPHLHGVGNVSIALIELDQSKKDFIFAQIQRRREGEFSKNPKLDRPFNQVRFSYLTREAIGKMVRDGIGFYSSLLYRTFAKGTGTTTFRLKDYLIGRDNPGKRTWTVDLEPLDLAKVDIQLVEKIVNVLVSKFKAYTNPGFRGRIFTPHAVLFIKPGLNLEEKLRLIDAVQYYVFPVLGVLTFALDQVTNQAVMFCFYDAIPSNRLGIDPTLIYTEERLMAAQADNYFATVAGLDPTELHHETLKHYLLKNIPAQEAVSLYTIEEKGIVDERKDPQDLIDQLFTSYGALSDKSEHPYKVLDQLKPDAILNLIADEKIPATMMSSLLGYEVKKAGRNLISYLPFHFAVPAQKRQQISINRQITSLLQDAIQNSPAEILDEIPEEGRETIYRELLLARNMASAEGGEPTQRTPARFAPSTSLTGISVLQGLLRRLNPDLLSSIRKILGEQDGGELVSDILTELNQGNYRWKAEDLFSLWDELAVDEADLYLTFLKQFTAPGDDYGGLAQKPAEFKRFLLKGQDLFSKPASWPDPELDQQLRAACVAVSKPISVDNVRFSEWWFFSRICAADPGEIREDYAGILENYASPAEDLLETASADFRFLASGGKLERELSLRSSCKQCDGERRLETTNEDLFQAVLETWIQVGCPIPSEDITYLVDHLPKTNDLLARIVRSNTQEEAVTGINSKTALRWLKNSYGYGVLRGAYQDESGKDCLADRLCRLEKPESDFVWHLLIEDKTPNLQNLSWADYLKLWDPLVDQMKEQQIPQSPEIQLFYDLAKRVTDPGNMGVKNRRTIRAIAQLHAADGLKKAELGDQEIYGLCIFAQGETDAYLQNLTVTSLQNYLQLQRQSYFTKEIQNDTIKLLLKVWEKYQPDLKIFTILKNEYRRRFGEFYR